MRRYVHPALLRTAYRLHGRWLAFRRPLTLGVRVVVRDGDGGVLLVRHSYKGGWHLPGGGVDKGESMAAAAVRELREETGLIAAGPARLISLHARIGRWGSDHVAVMGIGGWTGTPRTDGFEIVEVAFHPAEALPHDLSPGTRRRLDEILGGAAPGEFW